VRSGTWMTVRRLQHMSRPGFASVGRAGGGCRGLTGWVWGDVLPPGDGRVGQGVGSMGPAGGDCSAGISTWMAFVFAGIVGIAVGVAGQMPVQATHWHKPSMKSARARWARTHSAAGVLSEGQHDHCGPAVTGAEDVQTAAADVDQLAGRREPADIPAFGEPMVGGAGRGQGDRNGQKPGEDLTAAWRHVPGTAWVSPGLRPVAAVRKRGCAEVRAGSSAPGSLRRVRHTE